MKGLLLNFFKQIFVVYLVYDTLLKFKNFESMKLSLFLLKF